jgi:S1-C subfamily serine protease
MCVCLFGLAACGGPLATEELVERISPSTVMIRAKATNPVFPPTQPLPDATGLPASSDPMIGRGSGVVLEEGYIVTNAHVIEGANEIAVYLAAQPQEPRTAQVVGVSVCDDLALLKLDDMQGLTATKLERETDTQPGQEAVLLGYAAGDNLGVAPHVGTGIVTWVNPSGEQIAGKSFFKTDITVQAGDSGGPLLNRQGQVIGITTLARYASPTQNEPYVISAGYAHEVLERLKKGEGNTRLGFGLLELSTRRDPADNPATYAYFGLQPGEGGLFVTAVDSTGAAIVGMRPGDLIVRLNSQPLSSMAELCSILNAVGTSQAVPVEVLRREGGAVRLLQGMLAPGQARRPAAGAAAGPGATTVADAIGMPAPTSGPAVPPAPVLAPTAVPAPPAPTAAPTVPPPPPSLVSPQPKFDDATLQNLRAAHDARQAGYAQVVFDTFDNEGTKARWSPNDDAVGSRQLVNSTYLLSVKQPNSGNLDAWRAGPMGNNYIVELATAFASQGPRVAVGIAYDIQDNGDFSAFVIGSDGTWEVLTVANQAIVTDRYARAATDTIFGNQMPNTLRVVRLPDQSQFWINNTLVATVPAGPAAGGRVGVLATTGAEALPAPVSVIVDNLLVLQAP